MPEELSSPQAMLWWTRRRPYRPMNYFAIRAVFRRANQVGGTNWTLHDLRHSAAKRMVRDPDLTLADVQWVLGHAHITTTEIYTAPTPDEVIAHVLAHHERQRTDRAKRAQRLGITGMPRLTVPIAAVRRAWSRLRRRNVKVSSSPSTSPRQPSSIARCRRASRSSSSSSRRGIILGLIDSMWQRMQASLN
jgi:hypothetical protein